MPGQTLAHAAHVLREDGNERLADLRLVVAFAHQLAQDRLPLARQSFPEQVIDGCPASP